MSQPAEVISRQLRPGETLLWSGQPPTGVRLRGADLLLIPFSVLWCGFAIFWEVSVIRMSGQMGGPALFFILWGMFFVVIGLYFVFDRFFVDAFIRSQTFYGVTNERVVISSGMAEAPPAGRSGQQAGRFCILFLAHSCFTGEV
jgi:hypothetical protein